MYWRKCEFKPVLPLLLKSSFTVFVQIVSNFLFLSFTVTLWDAKVLKKVEHKLLLKMHHEIDFFFKVLLLKDDTKCLSNIYHG